MMTYCVETPEMGASILSDGVGKPFSVRLQLMMTYYVKTPEMGVFILSDRVSKPFSVRPAADDDTNLLIIFFAERKVFSLRKK